jgi:hypothetical protein
MIIEQLTLGEFTINRMIDNTIWIYHDSGEGGIFNDKELEKAIEDFYNKNF